MNKKRLLLEAVIDQNRTLFQIETILKEAISHPIFNFHNEHEYQLFEYMVGRAPRLGSIAIGTGGSGRFGKYTSSLGKLRTLIKTTKNVGMFTVPSDFLSNLELMFNELDAIVEIFDSENIDESIKKEARMVVYMLNDFLMKNFSILQELRRNLKSLRKKLEIIEKNESEMKTGVVDFIRQLDKKMSGKFSYLDAKGDVLAAERAGKEADEYEAKLKKGFFGGLSDKIKGLFSR
ncbi:hypothetical protein EBU95_07800 [bacterium]|nr:hypothetical protein [bacterium]